MDSQDFSNLTSLLAVRVTFRFVIIIALEIKNVKEKSVLRDQSRFIQTAELMLHQFSAPVQNLHFDSMQKGLLARFFDAPNDSEQNCCKDSQHQLILDLFMEQGD